MTYLELPLQEKANLISKLLEQDYPEVYTPLNHKNEFELLIATILSPQTKDETTNLVTPELFKKYPTAKELSKAKVEDVENIIRLVNYYKNKAKHVVATAKMLLDKFDGRVPKTMRELIELRGVGRKVANVVINEWFVKKGLAEASGFVIDTHVLRVSKRLGLTENTTPEKVEKDLMALFPKNQWAEVSLRMIFHGREWSQAKNPKYMEHSNRLWRELYEELNQNSKVKNQK